MVVAPSPSSKDLALLHEKLLNREWRLNNLYHIRDANGKKILFKMNEVQKELHDKMWFRTIIPKARKLGMTTFYSILYLDQALFSKNKTVGIIAHRNEDVKRIFRNIIHFAFDNLPPWLKNEIGTPLIDSASELAFNNGSSIFVSMTTRSGTPQFLHISEFGYIAKHAPDKAQEIVTGSINSVAPGNMISIESTAMGRGGPFYDLCMRAEQARVKKDVLTELDFKIFFFPWWRDPKYTISADMVIPQDMQDYFAKIEGQIGQKLKEGQKNWYTKVKMLNGEKMYQEFPSTLEEAFSVSLDGAYYGKNMTKVYEENRIGFFPVDPRYPVDTAWDLGINDLMAIVFFQRIGPEIRFVDCYVNHGEGLAHYAQILRDRGYRYGLHILPHDVQVRDLSTGASRLSMLWELGVQNTVVAPKTGVLDGIEKVRLLFSRFRFNESKTQAVADALQSYRKVWDDKTGSWSDKAVHDDASHIADAVRTMALVWYEQFTEEDAHGNNVGSGVRVESFF